MNVVSLLIALGICFGVGLAVGLAFGGIKLRHANVLNELLKSDRDYWKTRAEQLIDQHLGRAGAIGHPTMEQRKPLDNVASAGAMIAGALSVLEIDSSKKRPS